MDDSGLAEIERQRKELEVNINKLRKALQHWQTCEIEYEGLREEIASLPDGSNTNDVLAIARDFGAELVDERELQTIVGGQECPRSQDQIVDLLAKRVDYVSRNARTIEKQISDAQKKRNAILLAKDPDYREDAGLPLTDITEELDDDGNVVSSKVETPGSTAPQLVEVLKKAGVKDLLEQDGIVTTTKRQSNGAESMSKGERAMESCSRIEPSTRKEPAASGNRLERQAEQDSTLDNSLTRSRGDGNGGHRSSPASSETTRQGSSQENGTHVIAAPVSLTSNAGLDKTGESNDNERLTATHPDDTPEEAALRREMIQYGLGEVGAIVAELDLEENESNVSFGSDFDEDDVEDDVEDEDESENESGMVKHPALSKKYLEKMRELEEKHGIKGMQNLGPDATRLPQEVRKELERPPAAEAARKAALARVAKSDVSTERTPGQPDPEPKSSKPRKKVAFADDLDIAHEASPQSLFKEVPIPRTRLVQPRLVEPVKNSIVERQSTIEPPDRTQPTVQAVARKPSRFIAAREAMPQTPLLPPSPTSQLPQHPLRNASKSPMPPNTIHTDSIIERVPSSKASPPNPDDLDETIHRQEIAGEYYKIRNRMIQRQGGFVGDGEADNYGEEMTPLPTIDENGKEKKISRFKAARLR
ncbi:hypothetical protein EPUS_07541 [Endocarpon pusillum Z07020]|uniref:DUF3835 domain-containing protein n=1 Tax=Endocarpon pusillum (strain Z07020 / HMAS-L-300199) TaxID=1263415 RepID=U1HT05_ENDPU|nr:uncharacterized protein EPUS_07541 [Endocarpon pusillum Z07020]ERF72379.1 hypothetical protein EPUS_07541 [Endocarpon pusillum Z07020]